MRVADRVTSRPRGRDGELDAGSSTASRRRNDPLRLPEIGLLVAAVWRSRSRSPSPLDHPLPGRTVGLEDLVDARWIDAPDVCAPLAELAASPAPTGSARRCATTAPT